jgi:hypothetical protein
MLTTDRTGPAFLSGGGELGQLIRAKDWSSTPLGSPETWPETLHARLCRPTQQDLAHSVVTQPPPLDPASLVNLPEYWAGRDRGGVEPAAQRPDRAGGLEAAEHDHDLGAFAFLVCLGLPSPRR